jgi:hypothetical protein
MSLLQQTLIHNFKEKQQLQQGVRLQLTQVHLLTVLFGVQNARG